MKDIQLIHPMFITGNWDEGWALDKHVITSVSLGINEYGHEIYDTTRTEVGQQLYALKYNGKNTIKKLLILSGFFLKDWDKMKMVNLIIPAPPTNEREVQPVFEIARAIAEKYNIPCELNALEKISSDQQKNVSSDQSDIHGKIICKFKADKETNVLIIDDICRTGRTLNECVKVLRKDPLINKIFVFTMTKARG